MTISVGGHQLAACARSDPDSLPLRVNGDLPQPAGPEQITIRFILLVLPAEGVRRGEAAYSPSLTGYIRGHIRYPRDYGGPRTNAPSRTLRRSGRIPRDGPWAPEYLRRLQVPAQVAARLSTQ